MEIDDLEQDQDSNEKKIYASLTESEKNMLSISYRNHQYLVTTVKDSGIHRYMTYRESLSKAEKLDTPQQFSENIVVYRFV